MGRLRRRGGLPVRHLLGEGLRRLGARSVRRCRLAARGAGRGRRPRAGAPPPHRARGDLVRAAVRLGAARVPRGDPARPPRGRAPPRVGGPRRHAPGHHLGMRHVRDGRRGACGRAEARPRALAPEDVGRCHRRGRGRPARGAGIRSAGARARRPAARAVATGDGGVGGGGGGSGRRRRRVAVQAGGGREGLVVVDPGPRRRARPARFGVLRRTGGGGAVSVVRPRMSVGVAILGSTGSIGCTALQVLARQRERFRVAALTAHSNAELLERQVAEWKPAYVGLVDGGSGERGAGSGTSCVVGAATRPGVQIVLNGIVGAAGLEATLAALAAGKRVALANKETLVMAGELVTRTAREGGGEIVPVDSEHSAMLQCITGRRPGELARLILTASGGPFPTWKMGKKITVDSASLVNKALEVIEAHFLFGLPYEAVDVVVHPQSVVHAFVEFVDGSVLAQVGFPTMELPILYALTHPDRVPDAGARRFDPVAAGTLTFEPVDAGLYPAYGLGRAAAAAGGTAPTAFTAARAGAVELR